MPLLSRYCLAVVGAFIPYFCVKAALKEPPECHDRFLDDPLELAD